VVGEGTRGGVLGPGGGGGIGFPPLPEPLPGFVGRGAFGGSVGRGAPSTPGGGRTPASSTGAACAGCAVPAVAAGTLTASVAAGSELEHAPPAASRAATAPRTRV
jgi:hypothetical protein